MPGSYSSAGVGASHRPRLLWIPRVQRPPPLNPGDCSGRGKMPARAAESSPSATQQCSCRLCLPLSPSAHSPCAESPARAHRVATSFSFSGGSAQGLLETSLFRRFTFTSKACCHPLQPALVKFLPEVRAGQDFCSEARTMVKFSAPRSEVKKENTLLDPAKAERMAEPVRRLLSTPRLPATATPTCWAAPMFATPIRLPLCAVTRRCARPLRPAPGAGADVTPPALAECRRRGQRDVGRQPLRAAVAIDHCSCARPPAASPPLGAAACGCRSPPVAAADIRHFEPRWRSYAQTHRACARR